MKIRKLIRKAFIKIHQYLGIASSLVVFVVSITGCIYCFQDEIKDQLNGAWRLVDVEDREWVLPSSLAEKAADRYPQLLLADIAYYGPNRSAVVVMQDELAKNRHQLYFNPYSGEFLHEQMGDDFFDVVFRLHRTLGLPDPIGKQLTGISTLLFVLLIITGLVLWIPRRRNKLKQSLSIRWKSSSKRLLFDLHNVLGFYTAVFALLIGLSGLVFSYSWAESALYKTFNGKSSLDLETAPPRVELEDRNDDSIQLEMKSALLSSQEYRAFDLAFQHTLMQTPEARMMYIIPSEQADVPLLTCSYPKALHYDHQSNFYFHPTSGRVLEEIHFESKSLALQVIESCYGIHTGQLLGLTGKILAFLVSLVVASLSITGLAIWLGKFRKSENIK